MGHTREELQGAGLLEALAENKSERQLFDRYVRVVETGNPHDVEILYESHDAARWFRNMAVKLGDGVAVYFSDITERKEADDALRKADKLAAAGRMAATVAHEINNPLASVVNSLYLLSKEKLSTQSREYLDLASRELERVVRISRQTLSFYRGTDKPTKVDVLQVANDIVQAYAMLAERHGIRLELRGEGKHPVHGYPGEIRQMLANLLTNSLESGGSRVLVRIADVHRNGRKGHHNSVRISVVDDGKGINKEDQRRIFEPFFTTKGEKGTGLGLWVTRGIVTKHEGRLMLRSSTRQGRSGTSISVFLPRAPEHHKRES